MDGIFSVYLYQVYDGDNMNFPLVGAFCGNIIPSYFVSSGNFLTVHFATDGSVQRRGFNATYRALPCKTLSTLSPLHCTRLDYRSKASFSSEMHEL